MINKLKTLEHHHLIDGKYLKEDCIENLRSRLEELVPPCLHDELDRVLASFEDDCVGYDVSDQYEAAKTISQESLAEHEKTVTIPAREHNELSYAATLLQALKDFGVEDWDGWESAIESAEENHDGEMPT